MENLKKVYTLYYSFLMKGCNKDGAAKEAVEEVYKGDITAPYIYTDGYDMPVYIREDNYVLFFEIGRIYKEEYNCVE